MSKTDLIFNDIARVAGSTAELLKSLRESIAEERRKASTEIALLKQEIEIKKYYIHQFEQGKVHLPLTAYHDGGF